MCTLPRRICLHFHIYWSHPPRPSVLSSDKNNKNNNNNKDFLEWKLLHLYPKYICFVGTSWQVGPLEKPRLTFGISQKRVTLLPNQHMGVTVYPQSHHFSQYICSWGGRNSSLPQDTPSCDSSNTLTVCLHIFLLYRNGEK